MCPKSGLMVFAFENSLFLVIEYTGKCLGVVSLKVQTINLVSK